MTQIDEKGLSAAYAAFNEDQPDTAGGLRRAVERGITAYLDAARPSGDVKIKAWLYEKDFKTTGFKQSLQFERQPWNVDNGWAETPLAALRAQPAPAASSVPVGEVGDSLPAVARKMLEYRDAEYVPNSIFDRLANALEALTRQGEPEPVAWWRPNEVGGRTVTWMPQISQIWRDQGRVVAPLYTHPPATGDVDKLREALDLALTTLDNYADPTGYTDNYGDHYEADAEMHPGLLAKDTATRLRAALASVSPKKENAGLAGAREHAAESVASTRNVSIPDGTKVVLAPRTEKLTEQMRFGMQFRDGQVDHRATQDLFDKAVARITELEAQLAALREGKGDDAKSNAMETILEAQFRRPRLSPSPTAPGEKGCAAIAETKEP